MTNINPIGPVKGSDELRKTQKINSSGTGKTDFKETLNGFLNDVNTIQNKTDKSIEKMTTGKINDVHQVMDSVQEADRAFDMMMEIRNKVQSAYQEVMRMRR